MDAPPPDRRKEEEEEGEEGEEGEKRNGSLLLSFVQFWGMVSGWGERPVVGSRVQEEVGVTRE